MILNRSSHVPYAVRAHLRTMPMRAYEPRVLAFARKGHMLACNIDTMAFYTALRRREREGTPLTTAGGSFASHAKNAVHPQEPTVRRAKK